MVMSPVPIYDCYLDIIKPFGKKSMNIISYLNGNNKKKEFVDEI